MKLEHSTGELLARAVFMHHDDKGHNALMDYAALKGLICRCSVDVDKVLVGVKFVCAKGNTKPAVYFIIIHVVTTLI